MSAGTSWVLVGSGAALVVAGMAMLMASSARAGRYRWRPRRPLGRGGILTATSVVCGVITGVQWAVLSQTGPGAAWVAVLLLPAFLAAATVARLSLVVGTVVARRRRAQVARRGLGCPR